MGNLTQKHSYKYYAKFQNPSKPKRRAKKLREREKEPEEKEKAREGLVVFAFVFVFSISFQGRKVAIESAEEEGGGGEARYGSRLQVFLSSLISSIGGVLGGIIVQEDEEEIDMASRAVVVPHQQVNRGKTRIFPLFFSGLLVQF